MDEVHRGLVREVYTPLDLIFRRAGGTVGVGVILVETEKIKFFNFKNPKKWELPTKNAKKFQKGGEKS